MNYDDFDDISILSWKSLKSIAKDLYHTCYFIPMFFVKNRRLRHFMWRYNPKGGKRAYIWSMIFWCSFLIGIILAAIQLIGVHIENATSAFIHNDIYYLFFFDGILFWVMVGFFAICFLSTPPWWISLFFIEQGSNFVYPVDVLLFRFYKHPTDNTTTAGFWKKYRYLYFEYLRDPERMPQNKTFKQWISEQDQDYVKLTVERNHVISPPRPFEMNDISSYTKELNLHKVENLWQKATYNR